MLAIYFCIIYQTTATSNVQVNFILAVAPRLSWSTSQRGLEVWCSPLWVRKMSAAQADSINVSIHPSAISTALPVMGHKGDGANPALIQSLGEWQGTVDHSADI